VRIRLAASAAALLVTLVGVPLSTQAAADPLGPVVDPVATAAGGCDDLDLRTCLLPFPNDTFTALDSSTPTGRRVDLSPLEMPRNIYGKPVDPAEWNHNDGFSPGSPILTFVPGLDLARTFGLDGTPETGLGTPDDPWAVRDAEPDAVIEDPALSMGRNAPIVLLDADTGERHPYWAELDEHAATVEGGADRTLVVRPLVNLEEGRRYIVALRDLVDGEGRRIEASPAFATLRDGFAARCEALARGCRPGRFPAPADIDPADRQARYDDVLTRLTARGVDVSGLYLAWDFHVASAENLAGRALAIRDDAFAQLGDTDLADLEADGRSPDFTVSEVVDETVTESVGGEQVEQQVRTVRGAVVVPNYLTTPQDEAVEVEGVGLVVPQSRFFYGPERSGPMATPTQNPLAPTMEAEFSCRFRTDLPSVRPMLYGHGLLGSRNEATGSSSADLRRSGYAACGVDWIGMATEDITNVGLILQDMSWFASLPDRSQQGFLNFMYVGRALVHEDGLAAHPAFQGEGGEPLLDTGELFYDGNSQGGILGGALTALAPDFTKSVLGVPGMNYSTLLNRSVDWEGELFDPEAPGLPAYASFFYTAYPDKVQQQVLFALMQMLWDRGEGNGYAHHMTSDPYPNTPAHQVLLEVAFGDYQVANVAAEVEGRTIGADFLGTALAPGRHWERDYATGAAGTPYAFSPFVAGEDGVVHAPSGSALVYWDSGNPTPPNANVPPWHLGQDPHGDPRKDDVALLAKLRFFETGRIVDVNAGLPNWTANCPRHPEAAGC
jgi:hypothetical protein